MTDLHQTESAPAVAEQPSAIARQIASALVTRYHLRLTHPSDSRLGELTDYELGAAQWTGPRCAFVGFFEPASGDVAADVTRRVSAALTWARERLTLQGAQRCDILLVATEPMPAQPALAVSNDDPRISVGVISLDAAQGDSTAVWGEAKGLPSARELRGHTKAIRDGMEAPTLAAVDLAERQTVQGGYNQPVRRAMFNKPYATGALIGIWLAIWIFQQILRSIAPSVEQDFGALVIVNGYPVDWWRFVAYGFLHASFFHVALNSMAMFFFGRLIEQLYGRLVLVAAFVFCTIGGGIVWAVLSSPQVSTLGFAAPVVGASGGICGLVGMMLVIGRRQGQNLPAGLITTLRNNAIANIVYIMVTPFIISGIAWQAHVGGVAAGALVGLAMPPLEAIGGRPLRPAEKALAAAVIAIGVIALGFAVANAISVATTPHAALT